MDQCNPSPLRATDATTLFSFTLGYDGGDSDEDVMDLSDYDSSSDEGFGFSGGTKIANDKPHNRDSKQPREPNNHSSAVTEITTTTYTSCVTTKQADKNSLPSTSTFEPTENTKPGRVIHNSSVKPIHIQYQPNTNVSTCVTYDSVKVPARMPSITVLSGALISNVTGSSMKNHVHPSFPVCSANQLPSNKQSQLNIVKDSLSVTASLGLIYGALSAETTETINPDSVIKGHKSLITSKNCSVSLPSTNIVITPRVLTNTNEMKLGDAPKQATTFLGQAGNADKTCEVGVSGLEPQSQNKLQVDQNIVDWQRLDKTLNVCHQPICTIISSPTKPHGDLHETCVNKEQIAVRTLSKLKRVCKDVKRLKIHKLCTTIPTMDKNSKDFSAFIWPMHDKDANFCTEIDARLKTQRSKKEAKYPRPKQIMFNPAPDNKRHIFDDSFSKDPRVKIFSKTTPGYEHRDTKKLNSNSFQRSLFSSFLTNKHDNSNVQQHGFHQTEKGIAQNNKDHNDRLRFDGEVEFTSSSKIQCLNPLLGPFPKLLDKSVDNPNSSLVNSEVQQSLVSKSQKLATNKSLDAVSPEKEHKDNSHDTLHQNETESQLKKPREHPDDASHIESKKRRIYSKKQDFLMNLHESFMKNAFSKSKSGREDDSHKPDSHDKEQQRFGNFSKVDKHNRDRHSYRRVCKKEKRNVLDYHLCSRCMTDRTVAKIQPPATKIKSSVCLKCRKKLNPKDLMCKLCRQSFPNMMIYAGHVFNLLSSVRECKHYVCCRCKRSFPSRFTFHTHLAQSECANICLNCDRLFRSNTSLIEHSCI